MPTRETEQRKKPAASLQEAAQSGNSIEGYVAMNYSPDHEEIATIAYQFYLERAGQCGSPEEDWYRAEEEVRRRREQSESKITTTLGRSVR